MSEPDIPSVQKQPRRRTRIYDAPADNVDQVAGQIAALLVPPGTYVPCASPEEFAGWKLCNGQSLPKAEFPRLHRIFGGQFGEDATTFNLPDWTGRIPIGAGGAVGLENLATAGTAQIALTVAQLPAHAHEVEDPGHEHDFTPTPHAHDGGAEASADAAAGGDVGAAPAMTAEASAGGTVETAQTGVTVNETGEGAPVDILPPVFAVHWLVRV